MYNLEQLNSKELAELQRIATELGVKDAARLEKSDLMFRIIDEQADAVAQSSTEKEDKPTRKRTRVSVKNVDRVYSATQTKTKKIDKKMQVTMDDTLFGSLTKEEKEMLTPVADTESANTEEPTAEVKTETPKKRGRKKKEEAETAIPATEAPQKRSRKKKGDAEGAQPSEAEAADTPTVEEKAEEPVLAAEFAVPEATYSPETEHPQEIISKGSALNPSTEECGSVSSEDSLQCHRRS